MKNLLKKHSSAKQILIIFLFTAPAFAQTEASVCAEKVELATASSWANLRNSKESLKFKTSEIINKATTGKTTANFTISSTPNKFLTDYDDKDYCEKKAKETADKNRLVYNSISLGSADEVSSWISGFSQGSSPEGKELYKTCDKSCSPAYEYNVTFEKGTYKIKALVTCGPARDKDDNQYQLKTSCSL